MPRAGALLKDEPLNLLRRIAAASLRHFLMAKKWRENAFLTLHAARQSAPTKLSATPMPVQLFLQVLTYPTHILFTGRLEQSSETLYKLASQKSADFCKKRSNRIALKQINLSVCAIAVRIATRGTEPLRTAFLSAFCR